VWPRLVLPRFPQTAPTVLAEKVRVRILGFVECSLKRGIYSLLWAWVSVYLTSK